MKVIQGDLIKMAINGDFDIIIHGANCFNTMGGGIAKTIRDTWPEVYAVDLKTRKGDKHKLGTFTSVKTSDDVIVVNAYTQFRYWKEKGEDPNTPLVDYDAVRDAFALVKDNFGGKKLRFGIPKIGAGLALGDWDVISDIIEAEMVGEDLTLVEFVG